MSLRLMYITNRPEIAKIADKTGVDRIFVDMEYIGKEKRQAGIDSVKSHHTISDIVSVRKVLKNAELLVRVNPIHKSTIKYGSSYEEINAAIDAGADVIMLPMYRTIDDVENFLHIVNGRAKTQLLAETQDACLIMNQVVQIHEVDEIHLGLNDLQLAYHKKFMFELLADGTVDDICNHIKQSSKKFGFGGIARVGYGMLPAEYVIKEHYRIGSTCAILSRAFCNADKIKELSVINELFESEIVKIRETEIFAENMNKEALNLNHEQVKKVVNQIIAEM
ncbi:MAG: aldolase/citrate lyase family protein [Hespellia sp.]|nr:aldolase/citrate lyase family protein [Hespellia sp.]